MSTVKIQGISTKIIRHQLRTQFFHDHKDYGYSCRMKMSCFFVIFEAQSSITPIPTKLAGLCCVF